ncbi:MAG: hypothetical protein MZV64_22855 [Ignavibacteriales bacterium]|nr:hypothetical protein [Ignavibacteriales bacterium]
MIGTPGSPSRSCLVRSPGFALRCPGGRGARGYPRAKHERRSSREREKIRKSRVRA